MSESWRGHKVEDRRRIVENIRRRSVEEQRTVSSLVEEFGISVSTYQNWKRALDLFPAAPTTFRPVEVTALVPTFTPTATSALTLVTKSGHRIEGLSLEQAAQLVRALEC